MRTTAELLAAISRGQLLLARHMPGSAGWQSAAKELDELFEQLTLPAYAAVGSAFSATLLGVSARDLDATTLVGARLLEELRKRGLTLCRSSDGLSAHPDGVRQAAWPLAAMSGHGSK